MGIAYSPTQQPSKTAIKLVRCWRNTEELVRELSYAKDVQDMPRVQMGFMRSQLEAFGEQAS
jgi:hypothetical protein